MKEVQRGTPFSDRISVNGTGATRQLVLTIRDVRLEDQVEFICLIEGLTEGVGEGRTRLKVFGKIPLHFKPVSPLKTFLDLSYFSHKYTH